MNRQAGVYMRWARKKIRNQQEQSLKVKKQLYAYSEQIHFLKLEKDSIQKQTHISILKNLSHLFYDTLSGENSHLIVLLKNAMKLNKWEFILPNQGQEYDVNTMEHHSWAPISDQDVDCINCVQSCVQPGLRWNSIVVKPAKVRLFQKVE